MAEQHFTADDIADQGARQFEAGYAAAKAEQPAAAPEAVAWQVGDEFYPSESLAIEAIQQWGPSGAIAIPLYAAAPVAAAPGIDLRSRVLRLADKWEKQAAEHGVRQFTGNDHLLFANELRVQIDASPKGGDAEVQP